MAQPPSLETFQRFCMVVSGSNIKNKHQTSRSQVCEILGIDGATNYETGQWDVRPFGGVKCPKVGAIFTRTFVNGRAILLWNCVNHCFFLLNAPFFMKNSFFQRRKPFIAPGRAGFLASYGLGHREGHWRRQGQRPGLTVASAWNRGDLMGIPHFWGLYHPFMVMNGDSLWHWFTRSGDIMGILNYGTSAFLVGKFSFLLSNYGACSIAMLKYQRVYWDISWEYHQ